MDRGCRAATDLGEPHIRQAVALGQLRHRLRPDLFVELLASERDGLHVVASQRSSRDIPHWPDARKSLMTLLLFRLDGTATVNAECRARTWLACRSWCRTLRRGAFAVIWSRLSYAPDVTQVSSSAHRITVQGWLRVMTLMRLAKLSRVCSSSP